MAILPLIDMLEVQSWTRNGTQVASSPELLQNLQDKLNYNDGAFGYIVMNYHLITNQKLFKKLDFFKIDDNVIEAQSVLGPIIGFDKKMQKFLEKRVDELLEPS